MRPAVYRLPGAAVSQDQAWLSAVLACEADVVLSHGSAGAAWRLRYFEVPDAIDLLTTGWRPSFEGVRAHRTMVRGIPITTAERTLIDACGLVPFPRLERSLDDALRRRLIHLPRLVRSFDAIPVSGRRKRRPMERALSERLPGYHPGGSQAELNVMAILKRAGIRPLPFQQFRLEVEGHTMFLDFAWPETRTALEYDGREYHTRVSDFHRDQERIRRIQRADWTRWPITSRTTEGEIIAVGLIGIGEAA